MSEPKQYVPQRIMHNVAVLFPQMSWPSLHSACEAAWKARYAPASLTPGDAMKLATVANAYCAVFSDFRTLDDTRRLVAAMRNICRDEPCEFCKEQGNG
jgi:hypothetical protein